MPYMLVRHKLKDYAKWYPMYADHAAARKAGGCREARVFRNLDKPDEIVVLCERDRLENARKFTQSPDLGTTMERAGVAGKSDVYLLEEIERTAS